MNAPSFHDCPISCEPPSPPNPVAAQERRRGVDCPHAPRPSVQPASRPSESPRVHGTVDACLECGKAFREGVRPSQEFCSAACRAAFNNRRKQRGALLYDLVMALRFERGLARFIGLWTVVCACASIFRQEDHRDRDGRKSWRDPRDVIAEKPFLRAKRTTMRPGR